MEEEEDSEEGSVMFVDEGVLSSVVVDFPMSVLLNAVEKESSEGLVRNSVRGEILDGGGLNGSLVSEERKDGDEIAVLHSAERVTDSVDGGHVVEGVREGGLLEVETISVDGLEVVEDLHELVALDLGEVELRAVEHGDVESSVVGDVLEVALSDLDISEVELADVDLSESVLDFSFSGVEDGDVQILDTEGEVLPHTLSEVGKDVSLVSLGGVVVDSGVVEKHSLILLAVEDIVVVPEGEIVHFAQEDSVEVGVDSVSGEGVSVIEVSVSDTGFASEESGDDEFDEYGVGFLGEEVVGGGDAAVGEVVSSGSLGDGLVGLDNSVDDELSDVFGVGEGVVGDLDAPEGGLGVDVRTLNEYLLVDSGGGDEVRADPVAVVFGVAARRADVVVGSGELGEGGVVAHEDFLGDSLDGLDGEVLEGVGSLEEGGDLVGFKESVDSLGVNVGPGHVVDVVNATFLEGVAS